LTLSNLEELFLEANLLTGSFPELFNAVSHLTKLAVFDNTLTGTLPSFSLLGSLVELVLGNTQVSGAIPDEWSNLRNLELLDLGGIRNVVGSLPSSFVFLTSLQNLRLDLTGMSGKLPSSLGNMVSLRKLCLLELTLY
jgi:hypothetical protein